MPIPALVLRFLLAAFICCSASGVTAEIRLGKLPPMRLSADAAVGVEYDSNVSIEEVDRNSNESDYALTLDAGVQAEQALSKQAAVQLTYDYSASLYQTFSEVDRQTHIFGSGFTWKFEAVDTDLSVYYINSQLDGNKFLELYRVAPAISGFLAKKWFARGAYVYQDKTLADRELRDAITHSGEADLYYFIRGLRSYINLGYRYKDETAQAQQLDFRSNSFKLRYVRRVELFSKLAKLEFAWRYEDRDYLFNTPSIGEQRKDTRHRLGVNLEIPVTEKGAVEFYYGYGDYQSNLPRVDYTQIVAGTRFVYRW
jgi:hypothetical protein